MLKHILLTIAAIFVLSHETTVQACDISIEEEFQNWKSAEAYRTDKVADAMKKIDAAIYRKRYDDAICELKAIFLDRLFSRYSDFENHYTIPENLTFVASLVLRLENENRPKEGISKSKRSNIYLIQFLDEIVGWSQEVDSFTAHQKSDFDALGISDNIVLYRKAAEEGKELLEVFDVELRRVRR